MRMLAGVVAGLVLAGTALAAGVEGTDVAAVPAGTYVLDASHATVAARVSHMGFSETVVTFPKISGQLAWDSAAPGTSALDIVIDAAGLNSGWEARDGHLKSAQFFNVAAHPTITYKARSLTKLGERTARVDGALTLLGVTRDVPLAITFNGSGTGMMKEQRIGFAATADFKRSDFGMTAFLPGVGDQVEIVIDAEFTKK